jgi:hypothetical protein
MQKADILADIQKLGWKDWARIFTNNLFLYFPITWNGESWPGFYMNDAIHSNTADKLPSVDDYGPNTSDAEENGYYSGLLTTQTPRQFQAMLLEIAESFGYKFPEFGEKLGHFFKEQRPFDAKKEDYAELDEEVGNFLLNIYMALRERGYSHRDITC